jgi:hypothetical protein
MVIKYRLYRAPAGEGLSYVGEWDTLDYALAMAKRTPKRLLGLPRSEWETMQRAGGMRQWEAPDRSGDEDDDAQWWSGDYVVVRTHYR